MRSLRIILALLVGLVTLGNVPGTFNAINNNGLYVLSYTVVGSGGGGGTAYDPGSLGYHPGLQAKARGCDPFRSRQLAVDLRHER